MPESYSNQPSNVVRFRRPARQTASARREQSRRRVDRAWRERFGAIDPGDVRAICSASRDRYDAQSVLESLGHQALALSPTIANMVRDLQQLEQLCPLTLAAVHRFVVKELDLIS